MKAFTAKILAVVVFACIIASPSSAATNYPGALDDDTSLGVAVPGQVVKSVHHNNLKDAIKAVETKLGITGSGIASTIDYLLRNPLSVNPGHTHTGSSLSAINASTITTGTLSDARLSANIARLGTAQAWSALQTFNAGIAVSTKFIVDTNGNITKINNVAYSWPSSQGAASTFLQNDGSGNLSWTAIPPTNPGGLTGAVQFNSAGSFAGDTSKFYWDDTNFRLGIGNAAPTQALDVTGNVLVSGSVTGGTLSIGSAKFTVDTNGNITKINNVATSFPGSQGTSGQVLTNDGSGNLSWTTTVTGSGTATRVAFWSSSSALSSNANLYWDDSNSRLGINNVSPTVPLDVTGAIRATTSVTSATLSVGSAKFTVDANGNITKLNNVTTSFPSTQGAASTFLQNDGSGNLTWTTASGAGVVSGSGTATRVAFWSSSSAISSNANLYWDDTNSRLGIGNAAPTTTLDVTGSTKISSNLTVNGQLFTLGTAGSSTVATIGQGTTGSDGTNLVIRSGNSGSTAPAVLLNRNGSNLALWTYDGSDTSFDYTGSLIWHSGVAGTTRMTLTAAGNETLTGSMTVQGALLTVGTAGTGTVATIGQGTTGSDTSSLFVRSGNSGSTAASIILNRGGANFAAWSYDGTNTYSDFSGTLTWRTPVGGSTVMTLDSSGTLITGAHNPLADNTYDLGTTALRWKTLHLGPSSLVIHNDATNTVHTDLAFSGANAQWSATAGTPLKLTTSAAAGTPSITFNGDESSGTTTTKTFLFQMANTSALAISPLYGIYIAEPSTSWTGQQVNLYVENATKASGTKFSAEFAGDVEADKNLFVGTAAGITSRIVVDNGSGAGGAAGTVLYAGHNHASQTGDLMYFETSGGTSRFRIATNSATGASQEALVGIGNGLTPTSQLHLTGPQPGAVAGNGTAALTSITATGGKGGNTSGVTSQTGGKGGSFAFTAGAGGDATGVSGTRTAGTGGDFSVTLGAPGTTTGTAGSPGTFSVTGGTTLKTTNDFIVQDSAPSTSFRVRNDRNVIVPVTLLVGSDNAASGSRVLEVDGPAIIGGAFNSATDSGLLITSNGGTTTTGVSVTAEQKSNSSNSRPILFQSNNAGVAIGVSSGGFDTTKVFQVNAKTQPAVGDTNIGFSASGTPITSVTDNTYTLFGVSNTSTRSSSSHNLANRALVLTTTGGQHNDALVITDGMVEYTAQAVTVANGTNNNVSISNSFVRLTGPTASFSITGLTSSTTANGAIVGTITPDGGERVILRNTTSQSMAISNEDTNSTAQFRFHISSGANITLAGEGQLEFIYDATLSRWVDVASTVGAGGASGVAGSVQYSNGSGGFSSDASNFFWDSSNVRLGIGTNAPSVPLDVRGATGPVFTALVTDAGTTTTSDAAAVGHNSSGTPAAGFGTALRFRGMSNTTANQDMALMSSIWSTATNATRTAYLDFQVVNSASMKDTARIFPNGAAVVGGTVALPTAAVSAASFQVLSDTAAGTATVEANTSASNSTALLKATTNSGIGELLARGAGVVGTFLPGVNNAGLVLVTNAGGGTLAIGQAASTGETIVVQGSADADKYVMETSNGGASGIIHRIRQNDVQTANTASATTISTIATASNKSYKVHVDGNAYRTAGTTTGDASVSQCVAGFVNVAGTLTQIGTTSCTDFTTGTYGTNPITLTTSSTNILVQVNGSASGTDRWSATITTDVSSN